MKRILAAGWLVLVVSLVSEARAGISVEAVPERLDWSSFQPVDAIPGTAEQARIAAQMSFPRPLRIIAQGGIYTLPSFVIRVAPEPSQSMVLRSIRPSVDLLRHEQGHYDLVVLAARALARDLDQLAAESAKEVSRQAQQLVEVHTRRAEAISELYDRETEHSHEADAQARWSREIATALQTPGVAKIRGLPL